MIRIKIFDGNSYWMSHYQDDDGQVYLDVSDSTQALLSKEIEQLTNIEKINIEAVLGTSLPATPKNVNLIGKPVGLAIKNNTYQTFKIQLSVGLKIFNQSTLKVLAKKEGNAEDLEVEFLDVSDHWALQLNKIYLDELPFDDVEYSSVTMWQNMNNDAAYTPGDPGYYFPLVNYGRWNYNGKFIPADFRPWIHVAKVFELMFCKAGWRYECPILETDIGSRLITYSLKEDYGKLLKNADQREFKATLKKETKLSGATENARYYDIVFDDKIIDKGSSYNSSTGKFQKAGVYDFLCEFDCEVDIDDDRWGNIRTSLKLELILKEVNGTELILGEIEWKYEHYHNKSETATIYETGVLVRAGEQVYVRYRAHGNTGRIILHKNCFFSNKLVAILPEEGEIFNLKESLRKDKCIDYLKGVSHLFNFKFYTNFTERKVYILTPYDTDFFGDNITGFFQNTLDDWTDLVDYKQATINTPIEDKKNYYFKFKKTSDPSIEAKKLDEKEDLHSNYIDRGFDFKDETDNFENPYFEPTLNEGTTTPGGIYDMPQCLDNKDGGLSYNIQPRILIAAGMVEQILTDIDSPPYLQFFDNNYTFSIPYAYQKTKAIIGIDFGTLTYLYATNYLVYGKEEKDLFNLFYKKYFLEFRDCNTVELTANANYDQIQSITFRKRVKIVNKGTTQYGRFLQVDGYNAEKETGKLIFKADPTVNTECLSFEPEVSCANYPEIIVTNTGGSNYTISEGGNITSGVIAVIKQYREEDQTTWTTGSTFTLGTKKVICRILWTYDDGCPNQMRLRTVDPCGNYPKIGVSRTTSEPYELIIFDEGTHSETPTGFLFEYSVNGTEWTQVPNPLLVSDIPGIIYIRETAYYPNCPPRTDSTIYANSPKVDDCEIDGIETPLPMFVNTQAGLMLFRRGSFNTSPAIDIIEYREYQSNDEWGIYDDKNPEVLTTDGGKRYEARRIIIFCEGKCPTYCSDVVSSSEICSYVEIDSTEGLSNCDFEIKYENPSNPGSLTWDATIANDETFIVPKLRSWLEQDCGGSVTELYSRTVQWDRWQYKTECTWTWNNNYRLKNFKISRNIAGVQTLSTSINVDVLFVDTMTNVELKSEVEEAINNAMIAQFSAINGIHYNLIVTITGAGSTRNATVSFMAKKVSTSTWYGFKKGTDTVTVRSNTNVDTNYTATGTEFQEITTPSPTVTMYSPCEDQLKVRYKINIISKFIDDSASDFDTIILNSPLTVTEEIVTSKTATCQKRVIVPTVTGCTSPTYIWKQGSKVVGTTGNISLWGTKKFMLFVTCAGGCTYMKEF